MDEPPLKCRLLVSAVLLLASLFGVYSMCASEFLMPAAFSEETVVISETELLSGGFSDHFKHREFEKALKALDALLKKYPRDPLLLRYRGLTLDKLGRHKEAIAVYKQILAEHPEYIPAHLFLGLAYARDHAPYLAVEELRWVIENGDSEEYRHWAESQLSRIQGARHAAHPIHHPHKKPYLLGKLGLAYDSNPLALPDDKALSSRSREDGVDYLIHLVLGYPLALRKDFRVDVLYNNEELLHDGGAQDLDFTSQGMALDAKKRMFAGKRPVLLGGRYDFAANFLRSDLFSVIHRFLLSMDTSFWQKTRTHLYGRVSYSDYGPDGSNPDVSSRDGTRGGLGLIQFFYTNKQYKTYFFAKEEVSFAATRGDNFDRLGSLSRVGFHSPLPRLGPVDLELSAGLDYGTYPEFSSLSSLDRSERKDLRWDTYAGLTYHWKPNLATRGFYRFIHAGDDNDFFEHDRHIAGAEVIFSI